MRTDLTVFPLVVMLHSSLLGWRVEQRRGATRAPGQAGTAPGRAPHPARWFAGPAVPWQAL